MQPIRPTLPAITIRSLRSALCTLIPAIVLTTIALFALPGCGGSTPSDTPTSTATSATSGNSTSSSSLKTGAEKAAGADTSKSGASGSAEGTASGASIAGDRDGSAAHPLSIVLLPAESQSTNGVLGGMKPAFDAITKSTGLHFDAKASDSYASAVQALVSRKADLALLGPYTYLEARDAGAGELLAVAVRNGTSHYFGGIFTRADSGIKTIQDLKGKSVAFGDLNSTSSFNFQCGMMLAAGVDPSRDLGKIYFAGGHANSLAALSAGKVDACCASIESFQLAVQKGRLDPAKFVIIARSDPIPGSPWVLHPKLPADMKAKLRKAFTDVAKDPTLGKNGIRSEDGRQLDRFDTTITDAEYDKAMKFTEPVTRELKAAMLQKAAKN